MQEREFIMIKPDSVIRRLIGRIITRYEEKGLQNVPNKKLLHLEQVFQAVSSAVGSRDKLIGEIVKLQGREKDDDYKARLGEESTPSWWDRYQAVQSPSAGSSGK